MLLSVVSMTPSRTGIPLSPRCLRIALMCVVALLVSARFDSLAQAQTRVWAVEMGAPEFLQIADLARMLDDHAPVPPTRWSEVANAHRDYFERYKSIFEAADLGKTLGPSQRRDIAAWAKLRPRVDAEAAAAEAALFESLATIAAPEQRAGIDRIRRRWEATRISDSIALSDMDSPIFGDLTTLIYGIDDATAFRDALTPTLEAYEIQRVAKVAAFLKAAVGLWAEMAQLRAEAERAHPPQGEADSVIPGTGLAIGTQESLERERALQQAAAEFEKPAEAALLAIHAMQMRTLAALAEQLPSRVQRRLFDRFMDASYRNIALPGFADALVRIRRAQRLLSLTPQERDAIAQIEEAWWRDDRALCVEAMESVNARTSRQGDGGPGQYMEGRSADHKIFERRKKRSAAAEAELNALLGADRAALLDGPDSPEFFTPIASPQSAASCVVEPTGPEQVRPDSWRDLHPAPTAAWRAFIERRLTEVAGAQPILDGLWRDLERNWETQVRTVQIEVDSLWSQSVKNDSLTPQERSNCVKRSHELQLQSIAAGRQLVAAFVAQLQSAFPEFNTDSARAALLWYDLDWLRMAYRIAPGPRSPAWIPNVVRVAADAIHGIPPSELDRQIVAALDGSEPLLAEARAQFESLQRNQLAQRECKRKTGKDFWGDPTFKALSSAEITLNEQRLGNMRALTRKGYDALALLGDAAAPAQREKLQRLARRDVNAATLRFVPELAPLIEAAIESLPANDPRATVLKSLRTESAAEQERLLDEFLAASMVGADAGAGPPAHEISGRRYATASEVKDDLRQHVQRTVLQLEAILGREETRSLRDYRAMHAYFFGDGDRNLRVKS